jgi:hypothetical protein
MTTIHEDDTTGEQYSGRELIVDDDVGGDGLDKAGVMIGGMMFDKIEYHPSDGDYDALADQLHQMVDAAVESWDSSFDGVSVERSGVNDE